MADEEKARIFVEPPIPVTTQFTDIPTIRGIIAQLDAGRFRTPALLAEQMLWNPRLRAVLGTRLAGHVTTSIRFEPAKQNRDGRRAAKEFAEDWPLIASAPMRKQFAKWGLMLGLGLGQRALITSPLTGRQIFKLFPYWPGFATWQWAMQAYQVQTMDAGITLSASPSVSPQSLSLAYSTMKPPSESAWVVSEPFGTNSFRDALIHAAFRPWFGHDYAMRDQARASEKSGIGMLKVTIPRGSGAEHKAAVAQLTNSLQGALGSEGVVVTEDQGDGLKQNVEPLEFNGTGFQVISDTLNSNAVAFAILLLGHNLTTEIKGGGSYAAAGVADYIRDDIKTEDSATEWGVFGPQLAEPWAELNYGDPSLAPRAIYVTDSPAVNLQRAQMSLAVGQAAAQLRANIPRVDLVALADEFELPLLDDSVKVQVPPLPGAEPAKPAPTEAP
jgi:hypothetical protein